jgi:twitching motility protein PilT
MQTLESALANLYKQGLVTIEDALTKSSKPAELKRLIQG